MPLTIAITIGLSLLGILIGLDVWLAMDKTPDNTWSEILAGWSNKTALVPWIWSGLAGHFFHPNAEPIIKQPGGVVLLIWLTVAVAVVFSSKFGFTVPAWTVLIPGFIAGALLWPVS